MPKKYQASVPQQVVDRAINDMKVYMQKNKLSSIALAKKVGVHYTTIRHWLNKKNRPYPYALQKLIKAGVTDVRIPDEVRNEHIQKKLHAIDDKNKPKRMYNRIVTIPDIIRNQLLLLVDAYVKQLGDRKTWSEFQSERDELVQKLYFISKQGD